MYVNLKSRSLELPCHCVHGKGFLIIIPTTLKQRFIIINVDYGRLFSRYFFLICVANRSITYQLNICISLPRPTDHHTNLNICISISFSNSKGFQIIHCNNIIQFAEEHLKYKFLIKKINFKNWLSYQFHLKYCISSFETILGPYFSHSAPPLQTLSPPHPHRKQSWTCQWYQLVITYMYAYHVVTWFSHVTMYSSGVGALG